MMPVMPHIVLQVLAFAVGLFMVGGTLLSAIKTFVLPRAANVRISRFAFVASRKVFDAMVRTRRTYEEKDAVMAMFAPMTLVLLPGIWIVLVGTGFALMFYGVGVSSIREASVTSGSSLFTLGFNRPGSLAGSALSFVEAALGLAMIALLISYLPSIYAAFSRRETSVALLEALAGNPPTASAMLLRHQRIGGLDRLSETWIRWREWFADVEESHTSLAALVFFRSPDPYRSWITAAGCILDAAAISLSCLEQPANPDAALCIRAGYVALQKICDFFGIPYNHDPRPGDPISIRRAEFDEVWDLMAAQGVPLKADRDQAWLDYSGWRVNYDRTLLVLCGLVMAPPTPWSSDRGIPYRSPKLFSRVPRFHRI